MGIYGRLPPGENVKVHWTREVANGKYCVHSPNCIWLAENMSEIGLPPVDRVTVAVPELVDPEKLKTGVVCPS